MHDVNPDAKLPPVAVGGVGGSGTRVVARLLQELGYFLGTDLNGSADTLWFTLLFKRREILTAPDAELAELVAIFRTAMEGSGPLSAPQRDLVARLALDNRPHHDAEWLRDRAASLEEWTARAPRTGGRWGWKEPNTHVVLRRLAPLLPGMKYVHVVRNGLDMAYSANQAQLRLWGPSFLGTETVEASPRAALKFWRVAHRRVLEAARDLGDRFLMLNYDRLCADPQGSGDELLRFLDIEPEPAVRERMLSSIRPAPTTGRFRRHSPADFDPEDVAFTRKLGFDVAYETGSRLS